MALFVAIGVAAGQRSAALAQTPGPAGCPVDARACASARWIAGQLLAGEIDGVLAAAASRDYVCDGSDGSVGLGGPFPLCEGGAAGEHRRGYPWGELGSEGGVFSAAQYAAALQTWLASADLAARDAFGSGMPRLLGLACPAGQNCASAFTIVLTELRPTTGGPRRNVLLLNCAVDAAGQARIVATAAGVADQAPFALSGGSGGYGNQTFFLWMPSVLGLTPSTGQGGTVLAAHGGGFTPGDTVSVEIVGNLENRPLTRAIVGQDGRFTASLTMPAGGVYPAQVTLTAFPLSLPDRSPASIALAPTAIFTVTSGTAGAGALPVVGTGGAVSGRQAAPLAAIIALALAGVGMLLSRTAIARSTSH